MRNVRRYYLENAEYFITVVTKNRRRLFINRENVEILKKSFREAKERFPFFMRAFVFLPDHLHVLIQPKSKPEDVSAIVGITKRTFTQSICKLLPNLKEKKLWQARFHDHIIRDEKDFKNHVDYLHFNPVQHGWARKPEDFHFSTFPEIPWIRWISNWLGTHASR